MFKKKITCFILQAKAKSSTKSPKGCNHSYQWTRKDGFIYRNESRREWVKKRTELNKPGWRMVADSTRQSEDKVRWYIFMYMLPVVYLPEISWVPLINQDLVRLHSPNLLRRYLTLTTSLPGWPRSTCLSLYRAALPLSVEILTLWLLHFSAPMLSVIIHLPSPAVIFIFPLLISTILPFYLQPTHWHNPHNLSTQIHKPLFLLSYTIKDSRFCNIL